jgi:hypothetical protein
MADDLHFNQTVMTPKGKAFFIGYLGDGVECQVSRHVPANELSFDELIKCKPSIINLSRSELNEWIKRTVIIRNEIYPSDKVSVASKVKA